MSIDKLDLKSPDLVNENFEKLAVLFPNCVTEGAEGKAIDFDLLKQELNHAVVEGNKERYRLEWPGKREAIVTANLPTTKTLRPVRKDSVDFDNTENLYIEGDNLEVLKLLQESYLGKIKMIYIDPPYNTGKDFVYRDNFSKDAQEELIESGQKDEYNQRLVANPETAGRYHSDWLSMMYSRIKLARNLLTQDGILVTSIGVEELSNYKKLLDEIFGDVNFVELFSWQKTSTPSNRSGKTKKSLEYLLLYQKQDSGQLSGLKKESKSTNGLLNQPNKEGVLVFAENVVQTNLSDGNYKSGKYGTDAYDVYLLEDTEVKGGLFIKPVKLKARFKWGQSYLEEQITAGTKIHIKTKTFSPSYEKEEYDAEKPWNIIDKKFNVGTNENASSELDSLFNPNFSDNLYPKPVSLLNYILGFIDLNDSIILDFFSGSSTTAHAVMELNSKINLRTKYVMVQLPENTNEYEQVAKAGFKNLCEVGKERIRRAAKKIKEETNADIDYGFRVYRIDSSNMQDVYYKPQDYDQGNLDLFADNVKPDRTADDLLAQVMLDWGLPLSLKIEKEDVSGKKVFKVAENSLYACFDSGIDEDFAKAIAKDEPLRIVFKDSGFKNDTAKTNVKQLLKQLSPETEMKVI
jgi:adenine-specific DNA-methyltransferase